MGSFISGLSDLLRRKKITTPDYHAQSLFTVHTANQLLVDPARNGYLKKVKELVKMPSEHFDALYVSLVDNFVEFTQILPMRYGEHLSGIMQEGLRHALMAVELLFETSTRKPQPIYIYAVFSMALLADLIKVLATQKVMISDENGIYIDEWCPFTGSMVEQGAQYYKIREYGGYREAFLHSANPLLAERVMPDLGMRWIASNPRIFDMWLAVLTGHEDWAGELGFLLKLLKKRLEEKEKERVLWLEDVPMEFTEPEAVADGEKFLEWLKDALENDKISVNESDSFVHVLDDGVFIETPDVFDAFNRTYSSYRDFIVLQKQFNYLGITKLSGYDFRFEQHFATRADTSSRLGFLTNAQKNQQSQQVSEGALKLANEQQAAIKAGAQKADSLSGGAQATKSPPKGLQQGFLISDPAILFAAGAMPVVSKAMSETSVNWVQENELPKLPNQQQQQQVKVESPMSTHQGRR